MKIKYKSRNKRGRFNIKKLVSLYINKKTNNSLTIEIEIK